MKKVLLVLLALLVVAAGVVFLLLRGKGVSDGAELVPASTVAYLAIPDVKRSYDRWPQTALGRIAAEPQVQAFFGPPSQKVATAGGLEAASILMNLKPGKLFLALTELRENGADGLVGFRYYGGRKDLDAAMERLLAELQKRFPQGERTDWEWEGDKVTTFNAGGFSIHAGAHEPWGFLASSEAVLQGAMDRAAGRSKEPSLAASEAFKTVAAKVDAEPDLFWMAQLQPLFDLIIRIGEESDEVLNPAQAEQIRKLIAAAGSLKFDGADQREKTFVLMQDPPDIGKIDHSMMALTSADTSIFVNSVVNWNQIATDDYLASLPAETQAALAKTGIDLKSLPNVFGNEIAFTLTWRPGAMIPGVLLALPVKDRAAAESLMRSALTSLGQTATMSEIAGASVLGFPEVRIPLIEPGIAINDQFAMATLSLAGLDKVLSEIGKGQTLESAPAFAPVLPVWRGGEEAFAFVDAKGLFERVYNQLQPVLAFGGQMMAGNSGFDFTKLPQTETISQHLSPIVYMQKRVDDGYLIESNGPITMSQACVLVGAGAGASIASQYLKGGN